MFQQLSDTELMIMEYLWAQNTPKTFSEIKAFFEATTSKNWKKQTLSTFLLRLVKKGFYTPTIKKQKSLIIRHYLRKNITNNILLR